MFVVYLTALAAVLRGSTDRSRFLATLVLLGGTLMIAMHAVSDVGIGFVLFLVFVLMSSVRLLRVSATTR